MAKVNLGQEMWPVKEKENKKINIAAHIEAKCYPQSVRMCRYGSLININPTGWRSPFLFHRFRPIWQVWILPLRKG